MKLTKGIAAAMFLVLTIGVAARPVSAAQKKYATAALFSHASGLSAEERRLTLGLSLIIQYKLESTKEIRIVPESEFSMLRNQPNAKLIWEKNRQEASRVADGLKADVIIAGRVRSEGKDSMTAEFRVYTAGAKDKFAAVKNSFKTSQTAAAQKRLVQDILKEIVPVASLPTGVDYTSSASALSSFCEGVALLEDNKQNDALRVLSDASRADQNFRDLQYFLGQFYATRKFDYQKAISYLSKITTRNKDDHSAHYWLGFTYYLKGDSALATREFENATRIKPFLPEAYTYLAIIYKDRGLLDRVEGYYARALEYIPDSAALWYNYAGVQSQMQNAGAMASLRRALDLDCATFLPMMAVDADFVKIRKTPEFQKLVREYSQKCGK